MQKNMFTLLIKYVSHEDYYFTISNSLIRHMPKQQMQFDTMKSHKYLDQPFCSCMPLDIKTHAG